MMKRIAGLRDIADQFDLYFVDQYGVLHDGVAAYPGAVDGLARLASGGRKVIVLTNSGKGAPENLARLGALGFCELTSPCRCQFRRGRAATRQQRRTRSQLRTRGGRLRDRAMRRHLCLFIC
jgi:hypothetical protein